MEAWQTDRIRLRAFRAEDWTHVAAWNEERDWSYADTFTYPPQAPDQVRAWAEAEAAKVFGMTAEEFQQLPLGKLLA